MRHYTSIVAGTVGIVRSGLPSQRIRGACIALIAVILLLPQAQAQERQRGTITYITSTSAYVDLGTNQGFDVGDTVRIEKNGVVAAVLVVTNVASRSMAARIITSGAPLREGDAVSGIPKNPPRIMQPRARADSTPAQTPSLPRTSAVPIPDSSRRRDTAALAAAGASIPAFPAPGAAAVHGRVSAQFYALHSAGAAGLDFSQPALSLQFGAERLLDLPLSVALYSNHRYDARSDARRTRVTEDRLTHRVYQLSSTYGQERDPFAVTIGRFLVPAAGGVGTFDGVLLLSRSGGWETGIAGGSQPGYRESELRTTDQKFALYTAYATGDWQTMRYQGSAAFTQSYRDGAVDRGMLYLQNLLAFGGGVSLFQNASIDLFDISSAGVHTSPHLSDLYLSGSWRAIRWLTVNSAYSARRNVYYLRSFGSIPDSLFDRSLQHNVQLSTGANLPGGMFLSLTGALRVTEGSDARASSISARYSWAGILGSETNLYVTGSAADNVYNTSTNVSVEVNRDVLRDVFVAARIQRFAYRFERPSRTVARTALGIDSYLRVSRAVYVSLSYEHAWEGAFSTDRLFSDVSVRF